MAIGGGIFLIVVGAILAFALNVEVGAVDLVLVGWIMMGAGLLAILISLGLAASRRNTSHREEIVERRYDQSPQAPVVERRYEGEPPPAAPMR